MDISKTAWINACRWIVNHWIVYHELAQHISNSLTPDCNTSLISVRQKNDKPNAPAAHTYVSKLSEQLPNININDQITLDPDKNVYGTLMYN